MSARLDVQTLCRDCEAQRHVSAAWRRLPSGELGIEVRCSVCRAVVLVRAEREAPPYFVELAGPKPIEATPVVAVYPGAQGDLFAAGAA